MVGVKTAVVAVVGGVEEVTVRRWVKVVVGVGHVEDLGDPDL